MNLVIDDAVEVQLATRDSPEKRRQLGVQYSVWASGNSQLIITRANTTQGRQCFVNPVLGLKSQVLKITRTIFHSSSDCAAGSFHAA
jgi:hypothetical protein